MDDNLQIPSIHISFKNVKSPYQICRQFEVLPVLKQNQVNSCCSQHKSSLIISDFLLREICMNEFLLLGSLLISFGGTVLFLKLFGKSGLFVWIAVSAIFANIEVTVLVQAFGMEQTLGNTLFASSFLATDILSELYGKKHADKGVRIGIIVTLFFIIFSSMWLHYIPSQNDRAMSSIKALFSNTPRILIASLVAYAISQSIDVWLYHKWWALTKKKTGSTKKMLWFRNNFSTLISQFINIVIFNFGSFLGVYKFKELLSITAACYIIYLVTSILDTPFVYLARKICPTTFEKSSPDVSANDF